MKSRANGPGQILHVVEVGDYIGLVYRSGFIACPPKRVDEGVAVLEFDLDEANFEDPTKSDWVYFAIFNEAGEMLYQNDDVSVGSMVWLSPISSGKAMVHLEGLMNPTREPVPQDEKPPFDPEVANELGDLRNEVRQIRQAFWFLFAALVVVYASEIMRWIWK